MRLPLLLMLALCAVPLVVAQTNTTEEATTEEPSGPIEIVLETHESGGYYFTREGDSARNPTLTVQPGQEVTIRVKGKTGLHNVHVTGVAKGSDYVDAGEETTYKFTAPAQAGRLEYWCDPHKSAGMKGTIVVGDAPAPDTGSQDGGAIEGETVEIAECPGQPIPAVVTTGVVGAPSLADYQQKCAASGDTGTASANVRPPHVADYVIPLSWAAIALGIVAVVWVHKSYKP